MPASPGSTAPNIANRIVARLIDDIEDRKGLGNEWEMIDSATRGKIRTLWRHIIMEEIER